ncbi:MAG: hypothetical protein HY272_10220 [Gammaproteobacteria bacterium]|nr:hypothetical protein [Gammaproteobacteria bacterium]
MRQPWFVAFDAGQVGPAFLMSVTLAELMKTDPWQYAFLVIDTDQPQQAEAIIRAVRQSHHPALYLLPIVGLHKGLVYGGKVHRFADVYLPRDSFDQKAAGELVSQFEPVLSWIDGSGHDGGSADVNIAFKVLRMIASRGTPFVPVATASASAGYVYPLIEPLFDHNDAGVLQTLEYLQDQRLLHGEFFARAHFCSHCDCAFLNFTEACPHCGATDLKLDELVHHFKCAYTGELSEFKRGETMVCPKCEQLLRHIGVDYDKPSLVYHCNQCTHAFQDPRVMSMCYNCGRSVAPENQLIRIIQSYSVSSLGENAARYGMESLFANIFDSELKLASFVSFMDFCRIEVERIRRYKKSSSTLVLFEFSGLDALYIKLGKRARDVFMELSAIFKSILRRSDVITARNETVFLVVMTETDMDQARLAVGRLEQGIIALFENNLSIKPRLRFQVYALADVSDPQTALEQFLSHDVVA